MDLFAPPKKESPKQCEKTRVCTPEDCKHYPARYTFIAVVGAVVVIVFLVSYFFAKDDV